MLLETVKELEGIMDISVELWEALIHKLAQFAEPGFIEALACKRVIEPRFDSHYIMPVISVGNEHAIRGFAPRLCHVW